MIQKITLAAVAWAVCVQAAERGLQEMIDAAAPNSTVLCDPNREYTFSTPLKITKPLTLRGLHARLPAKLGRTALVEVTAKGVTVTDFQLTGNNDSVEQKDRAPLLIIGAGEFRVERGTFINSTKDGVMIDADVVGTEDIVGGVVRDIVGRKVSRDVVSISGGGHKGFKIRNVLVDNVRGYQSSHRGAVEVSDGSQNITVRKVYAEDSVYGIDVQDHSQPAQINRHVVLEDIFAVRCKNAIRTNNKPLGHAWLTIRDVTADHCSEPLQISNTDNVTLSNIRVLNHTGAGHPIYIKNCNGVFLRDVTIENSSHNGPAVLLENSDAALIDGVRLRGSTPELTSAICYRIAAGRPYSGLRITNVSAAGVKPAGIVLEPAGLGASLADYIISGNLATVLDKIQGPRAIRTNNLP